MDSSKFEYAIGLPNSLFTHNRQRFLSTFKAQTKDIPANSIMLFKGAEELSVNDIDISHEDRQESFFYYLFGVKEMGFYACINIATEEVTLFLPKMNPLVRIVMVVYSTSDIEKMYGLKTMYLEDMEGFVEKLAPKKVYLNDGINSDSKMKTIIPKEKWLEKYPKDSVHIILSHCRSIKSEEELNIMRIASKACCECHVAAMKACKPGLLESYLMSVIRSHAVEKYNALQRPYGDIVASGVNGATLHYVVNNKVIKEGELILCDCGLSVHGYGSDITTVFPVNGKFTPEQKTIYNIVLKINRTVQSRMKPGVSHRDSHMLAEKILLTELKALGILNGDVDKMLEERVGYLFMPHGLGHFLGLDVHDVGGYIEGTPERIMKPGLKSLRTSRVYEKGMVITIEPGCYFIDFLLKNAKELVGIPTSYVNFEKLKPYMDMGGVRIEDDVAITETGSERLTCHLPRTIEQIEACMAKPWETIPENVVLSDLK